MKKSFVIQIFLYVTIQVRFFRNKIKFNIAKRRADALSKLTGRRYFVIPAGDNRLAVVDNKFIKLYNEVNRKLPGFKKMTIVTLLEQAYYATSTKGLHRF